MSFSHYDCGGCKTCIMKVLLLSPNHEPSDNTEIHLHECPLLLHRDRNPGSQLNLFFCSNNKDVQLVLKEAWVSRKLRP